ncbi:CRISPR-associated endonuclease Cas2 [Fibrobacteria bacterium R8-3-H12]
MTFVFAYDISENKTRAKVAKTLERFGIRVQKSFFQINAPKEIIEQIRNSLLNCIDKKTDRLFIYPVCEDCSGGAKLIGNGKLQIEEKFIII